MSATSQQSTPAEDHLDVDTPVPGQNFVCLSFVSPEKILKQKDKFLMNCFWSSIKKDNQDGEESQFDMNLITNIEETYEVFLQENEAQLEEEFHKRNEFQTSVRGVKVRGIYNTMEEANIRAKVLQRVDKHHHVFVAPVGYWLPWDPNAENIEDQVYQEEQLNELMKNYKENEVKRDIFYEDQKSERKKKAIEENLQRKKENDENEKKEKDQTEQGDQETTGVIEVAEDDSFDVDTFDVEGTLDDSEIGTTFAEPPKEAEKPVETAAAENVLDTMEQQLTHEEIRDEFNIFTKKD
jgi:hypothetical protein